MVQVVRFGVSIGGESRHTVEQFVAQGEDFFGCGLKSDSRAHERRLGTRLVVVVVLLLSLVLLVLLLVGLRLCSGCCWV